MAIIIQGSGAGSTLRDSNSNSTQGACSTVSGGQSNQASNGHTTVGGGLSNSANSNCSTVGGGACNRIYGTLAPLNSIGGGWRNTITNLTNSISSCSIVGGGACNTVLSSESVIVGGLCNIIFADNTDSSILGGRNNSVVGPNSFFGTIGGGRYNTTFGSGSIIGGGSCNTSCSNESVIGGGCLNTITKYTNNQTQSFGNFIGGGSCNILNASINCYSVIGGGFKILNNGTLSFVGGGESNTILSNYSTIVGGCSNTSGAGGVSSFIGGGLSNTANARANVIGGGCKNTTTNNYSVIGGGFGNTVTGEYSGVLGGCSNTVTGSHSFAVSVNAKVTGNCTVAIGGSSINASVSNSVYVPKLNIRDLPNNVPVYGLGIDANGFVVKSLSPGVNCVVDGILTEGLPTSLSPQIPSISTSLLTGDLQLIGSSVLYDDYTNSFNPTTGIWTCPATGRWNIGYFVHMTGPDPLNGWLSLNGMIYAGIVNFTTNEVYAASTYYPTNVQLFADINGGQWGVQLTAGDQLCVRITNTTVQNYVPVIGGTDYVRFSAQKIG
jgi:hypothetical protein